MNKRTEESMDRKVEKEKTMPPIVPTDAPRSSDINIGGLQAVSRRVQKAR